MYIAAPERWSEMIPHRRNVYKNSPKCSSGAYGDTLKCSATSFPW